MAGKVLLATVLFEESLEELRCESGDVVLAAEVVDQMLGDVELPAAIAGPSPTHHGAALHAVDRVDLGQELGEQSRGRACLLYTSDAADD